MKSILSTVALVATFAVSEGMIYPPLRGTVDEEISRIHGEVVRNLNEAEIAFDEDAFVEKLNPSIKERTKVLLQGALEGDKDSLKVLFTGLHCETLYDNRLFADVVDGEGEEYMYAISMKVLGYSIHNELSQESLVLVFVNLLTYCRDKCPSWVLQLAQPVQDVRFEMMYMRRI